MRLFFIKVFFLLDLYINDIRGKVSFEAYCGGVCRGGTGHSGVPVTMGDAGGPPGHPGHATVLDCTRLYSLLGRAPMRNNKTFGNQLCS